MTPQTGAGRRRRLRPAVPEVVTASACHSRSKTSRARRPPRHDPSPPGPSSASCEPTAKRPPTYPPGRTRSRRPSLLPTPPAPTAPGHLRHRRRRLPLPGRRRSRLRRRPDRQRRMVRARRSCSTRGSSTATRLITNPNVVLAGIIGRGKSTLAKSLATRSIAFGKKIYVPGDPKGEWSAVARAVGGQAIELGGTSATRLNPLDEPYRTPDGSDSHNWQAETTRRRRALLGSLTETALGRPLNPVEHTALDAALNTVVSTTTDPDAAGRRRRPLLTRRRRARLDRRATPSRRPPSRPRPLPSRPRRPRRPLRRPQYRHVRSEPAHDHPRPLRHQPAPTPSSGSS